MSIARGFLPTAYLPRAHSALARAWRAQPGRKRFDAIFLTTEQISLAKSMGWEEFGNFVQISGGWADADTLACVQERCDVSVLLPGEPALYANCLRAAQRAGVPEWITWQESRRPAARLNHGPLLAELRPAGEPDFSGHLPFDSFWREVDRNQRITWILRLDAIGDVLLTLCYLYPFKRRHPGRRIGLVVRKEYVQWLRQLPWIDEICGVDIVYWDSMLEAIPKGDGKKTAWVNLMPGMLRVAGNKILTQRNGIAASAYPDAETRCEYSPGKSVLGMRELLALAFGGVEPELPVSHSARGRDGSIWFSPFPGADERLWPPDAWAAALAPLAGKRLILQPSANLLHERWHAEFLRHAAKQGLIIESAGKSNSILDLIKMMAKSKAWIGINSAPMHAAALIGMPSLAVGLPWEVNARWNHPCLKIVAAEGLARQIQQSSSPAEVGMLVKSLQRSDEWADGLFLRPEVFADALRSHAIMELL